MGFGLAGVLGEDEPEPVEAPEEEEELEEPDPEPEAPEELEEEVDGDEAVADFAFEEGSGVKGLRGAPECRWAPLVVSATA